MHRQVTAAHVVAQAVDAAEAGYVDIADDILRRGVHFGLRPTEIIAAALAAEPRAVMVPPDPKEPLMLIVYEGPGDGRRLAPTLGDIWCPRGVPVEVPDHIGRSLCRQPGFTPARRRRRTETPERPTETETPESPDPSIETR